MTEQTGTKPAATDEQGTASHTWKRRGLFAAAWAAVIGLVLKFTAEPVEAAAALQFANTTATVTNTAAESTIIIDSLSFTSTSSVFVGQSLNGNSKAGLQGVSGLRGSAPIFCGVFGESGRGEGTAGVMGYGNGSSIGVMGTSDTGMPILAQVRAGSSANTIAIYGINNSTYAGPSPGAGGFGIYGLCAKGHGLVGATATAGGAAVVGATNGVAGAYAGAFYGPVLVGGAFTVFGPKSAAVPHPDGTHRRLYCMESPESWFEDVGEGQLACGEASITLDPDFAAVADLSKYHVFLTGYDDFELRVSERTPAGFLVKAKDEASRGAFSWRVVAKRKDIPAPRFETVTVPHEPVLPPLPEPVAPAPRDGRRR
jgi:hypothetical protein